MPGFALRPIDPPIRIDASPANPFKQLVCGGKYDGQPHLRLAGALPARIAHAAVALEALPRDFDLDPGSGPGQAQDLRYDLRILQGAGVVYERLGLSEPSHALEEPLPACGEFRWTCARAIPARRTLARHRVDGRI